MGPQYDGCLNYAQPVTRPNRRFAKVLVSIVSIVGGRHIYVTGRESAVSLAPGLMPRTNSKHLIRKGAPFLADKLV